MAKRQNSGEKGLSLSATIALIVIILFLGIGTTIWYFAIYKVAYVKVFDIEVETVEYRHVGFNADPALHFGKIPATGGTATKEMNLFNDWDIPLLLKIQVRGNASTFISTDANMFIMQPNETRKLVFYATVPEGFGMMSKFTGDARITYLRP